MNEPATLVPFAGVIVLAYLVQTATGFGSMIVGITLGALLLPIDSIVAVVVPLSLAQNLWIAIRHRDGIDRRLLFVVILPVMGIGMVIGFLASERVAGDALRIAFGVMVLTLAARELYVSFQQGDDPPRPLGRMGTALSIFGAGILHGIYATGGPLLVYAVGRLELGKHVFRSTLTTVWLLLNIVLTAMLAFTARLSAETLTASAMLLPAIPLGILLGEWIHRRVDELRFRRILFAALIVAALPLIVR